MTAFTDGFRRGYRNPSGAQKLIGRVLALVAAGALFGFGASLVLWVMN